MQTLIWIIFMSPLDALNHLLNLFAPAAAMAVLLVWGGRLFLRQCHPLCAWWKQMLLQWLLGSMVLAAGMALWGHDGKMLTYAALVVATASGQWVLLRGWKP